jgi:hypothetical protein
MSGLGYQNGPLSTVSGLTLSTTQTPLSTIAPGLSSAPLQITLIGGTTRTLRTILSSDKRRVRGALPGLRKR